jgi:hypothetical protein
MAKSDNQACTGNNPKTCCAGGSAAEVSCCGGTPTCRWQSALWLLLIALVVGIILHALFSDSEKGLDGGLPAPQQNEAAE